MKILQLCSKPPLPLLDGGCIAMHNISTGLIQANIDLKILTVATEKHPFDSNAYDKDFISKSKIESVFINTKVTITGALTSIFKRDSYNISRFYSKKFELRLIDILQENNFDIVQLESLYMSPYIKTIRQFSSAKIALRAHNIEHTIWSQLATDTINPIKKIYLKLLAKKLKSYEINTFQIVDAILPISNEDEQQIKKIAHIFQRKPFRLE